MFQRSWSKWDRGGSDTSVASPLRCSHTSRSSPTLALVHLETFGTKDALADGKFEVVEALAEGGVAVLPVNEPRLARPHPGPTVTFRRNPRRRRLGLRHHDRRAGASSFLPSRGWEVGSRRALDGRRPQRPECRGCGGGRAGVRQVPRGNRNGLCRRRRVPVAPWRCTGDGSRS